MNTENRNRELIKLINGMEALGYQVDVIEWLSKGDVRAEPGGSLITIKASPLCLDTAQRKAAGARRRRNLMEPLDNPISRVT